MNDHRDAAGADLDTSRNAPNPYSEATELAFRSALLQLATSLPEHHHALARLVDEGQFHDVEAILAVLEGGDG